MFLKPPARSFSALVNPPTCNPVTIHRPYLRPIFDPGSSLSFRCVTVHPKPSRKLLPKESCSSGGVARGHPPRRPELLVVFGSRRAGRSNVIRVRGTARATRALPVRGRAGWTRPVDRRTSVVSLPSANPGRYPNTFKPGFRRRPDSSVSLGNWRMGHEPRFEGCGRLPVPQPVMPCGRSLPAGNTVRVAGRVVVWRIAVLRHELR